MATSSMLRLPLFLLGLVVLSLPFAPKASATRPAQLTNDDEHIVKQPPPSAEMPHWLSASDASLITRPLKDGIAVDAVVSLDGTGNYRTIGAAIAAAPLKSLARHVIHVKAGLYNEYLNITADTWNLVLIGDGMENTVITGNRTAATHYGTMYSGTVTVRGTGFIARDLRIENTAGPMHDQAVALVSDSDHSVLYRCSIRGYQDTLYARTNCQFYRECEICGTVDFIFGDAAAVFQNCTILVRLPIQGQENTITAQGRADGSHGTGFVFQFCRVAADDELLHANFTVNTYLGRPWRNYSRVVFKQSFMSDIVHPDGWLKWDNTAPLDKLYYAEFKNSGPGAKVGGRVQWPGVHRMIGEAEASNFTVEKFINGSHWLPSTGVGYIPGLNL